MALVDYMEQTPQVNGEGFFYLDLNGEQVGDLIPINEDTKEAIKFDLT